MEVDIFLYGDVEYICFPRRFNLTSKIANRILLIRLIEGSCNGIWLLNFNNKKLINKHSECLTMCSVLFKMHSGKEKYKCSYLIELI